MTLRTRWVNGILAWEESATGETVDVLAAVKHKEDFLGDTLNLDLWGTRDTGGATETVLVSGLAGILELALTATNEIQLAGVDEANDRQWALNKNLAFEARARFTTLPGSGVVVFVGLCGDHNAAAGGVVQSIWFRWDGSGTITVETDDGTNETSQVATGITVIANQWVTLRIECEDPAAVRFYIDGSRVASGTTFNMSAVPSVQLQRVARVGKEAASTAVGTMQVDSLMAWQARA